MDHKITNDKKGHVLRILKGKANPNSASDRELFLLEGDAAKAPIRAIIPADGVDYPTAMSDLQDNEFILTIYHFNDVHGHLARFSQMGEEDIFTRMASKIKKSIHDTEDDPYRGTMALSAGDDCVGSVFDELFEDSKNREPIHASYKMYSASGVDLAVLGNHDFDLGLDVLAKSIQEFTQFPILAANLRNIDTLEGLIHPGAILIIKGIRIGLIGLVTSAETKLDQADEKILNPIPIAKNLVRLLRPLCDVVVLLTHLGYSLDATSALTADAGDVELAKSLSHRAVDLIVGGHSHHVLNESGLNPRNIVNGIPIVQAGSLGNYLGQVDICITHRGASVGHARLIATETLPVDKQLKSQTMEPLINKAREYFSKLLGTVEDNPHLSTEYVRTHFSSGELELANFITDGLVKQLRNASKSVDLAMIDSSCVRTGLNVGGKLTYGDWFNLMPFADTMRFYNLTGRQLMNIIQDNSLRVDRPDEPNTERGFLQFSSELRYQISLGKERREAFAKNIKLKGVPLTQQMDQHFIIVSTSFVRKLAEYWELCPEQISGCELVDINEFPFSESDYFLRREMVEFIIENGGVTSEAGATLDGRLKIYFDEETHK